MGASCAQEAAGLLQLQEASEARDFASRLGFIVDLSGRANRPGRALCLVFNIGSVDLVDF